MNKIFLYIGTYTLNTKSKGIYLFHFDLVLEPYQIVLIQFQHQIHPI